MDYDSDFEPAPLRRSRPLQDLEVRHVVESSSGSESDSIPQTSHSESESIPQTFYFSHKLFHFICLGATKERIEQAGQRAAEIRKGDLMCPFDLEVLDFFITNKVGINLRCKVHAYTFYLAPFGLHNVAGCRALWSSATPPALRSSIIGWLGSIFHPSQISHLSTQFNTAITVIITTPERGTSTLVTQEVKYFSVLFSAHFRLLVLLKSSSGSRQAGWGDSGLR